MGDSVRLFLCGDVMTGRGIDQVLPHPSEPELHESWVTDARDYVALAERMNGGIPAPVDFAYIWGDALPVLSERAPDLRLINLETSITHSDDYWRRKGIHYRMNPDNTGCLTAAGIDCCALANNHVLDWGYSGLVETLQVLEAAGIAVTGAGLDVDAAVAPAVLVPAPGVRVLVFSFGLADSGIPETWAARKHVAGVNRLSLPDREAVVKIADEVAKYRRPGDIVIASIHWGGNWGYDIGAEYRDFAQDLIDEAGVHLVHGHSSHHPRAIEVYRGRAVLYGCGDFVNDYEGIDGYEAYRADLTLMYFADIDLRNGHLLAMELVPMQLRQFRLNRADPVDREWLAAVLRREGATLGTTVAQNSGDSLLLKWR